MNITCDHNLSSNGLSHPQPYSNFFHYKDSVRNMNIGESVSKLCIEF